MRRPTRWLLVLLSAGALVAAGVTAVAGPAVVAHTSTGHAQLDAAAGPAAFLGLADSRPSVRLAGLVGSLGAVVAIAAALMGRFGSSPGLVPAITVDRRRRWRARLVGAPPSPR
jgi:hypothetical protein